MHLFLTVFAGMIVLGVMIMAWAMFKAKPDPNEEDKNRGKVIHYVDEKGQFHYKSPLKKVK
jgi:hypothetical protein